jgi:hypothetical protein
MGTLSDCFTDRLPFVIGVTGHRDIPAADEARLGAAVDAVLSDVRGRVKHTPVVMLCGMATGADLLCAERALAAGIPVCALLPVAIDRYEQDFAPSDLPRFHAALAQVVEIRVLADDPEQGYVRLAQFLARYSHLVIALWDGVDSRGRGGTGDVVRMRVEGTGLDPAGIEILAFPDVGPVVHIPTARTGEALRDGAAATIYPPRFEGDRTAQRDYDAATARLECFNRDLAADTAAVNARSLHDAVDALSNALQRRIRLVTNVLYVVFAAATTVQILRLPAPLQTGLLALGLLLYAAARRANVENRYQDYRALSEALRVRQAWAHDGIAASVDACYLRMHQSELQWIRLALRTVDLVDPIPARTTTPAAEASYAWLEGQWGFYARTREREERRRRRIDTAGRVFIVAGAICAALAWILPQLTAHLHASALTAPASWFRIHGQTVFTLASAYAAILAAYASKFGFGTNAKRYERMYLVFDVVKRRISKLPPNSTRETEALLLDLGREALVEHADWLLQRRERPLTFTIQR